MTIWKLGFGFDKYLNYLYIIRASAASQKKNSENKIKTTLGPPLLSIKLRDKTPPLTNLRGGGDPDPRSPPPLWIRAWVLDKKSKMQILDGRQKEWLSKGRRDRRRIDKYDGLCMITEVHLYGMSNVAIFDLSYLYCIISYLYCIISYVYCIISHLYCIISYLYCIFSYLYCIIFICIV